MLDADRWLEDRLRIALREEAEALPFTLTLADLERRLAERRSVRRRLQGVPMWWAAAALLLLAGAAIVVGATLLRGDRTTPPPAPTTIPSAVVPVNLPTTAELLAEFPEGEILFEARHDPATATSTPPPDGRYRAGTVDLGGAHHMGLACSGGDEITVILGDGADGLLESTEVPCDGKVHAGPSTGQASRPQDVLVEAAPGIAWAVAIGAVPAAQAQAPSFAPLVVTDGWIKVLDSGPTLATSNGSGGAQFLVPPLAERVAAWVACQGDAPAEVTLGEACATIDCPSGQSVRVEAAATPGKPMNLRTESEGPTWFSILIEADAPIDVAYPSAPPLPADVAATGWAGSGTDYLTLGTVGGAPHLVPLGQHQAGTPRDGVVTVATAAGEGIPARLLLLSADSGEAIATLVERPGFILESWLDPTHGQALYTAATPAGFEIRRVGLDGSGDRLLTIVPATLSGEPDLASVSGETSLEDDRLVVDACRTTSDCARTIVDLESGDAETVDVSDRPLCSIVGIADGFVVGYRDPSCTGGAFDPDAAPQLVIQPLDGTGERIVDDIALSGGGQLVETNAGPVLVATTMPRDDLSHEVVAISLADGEVRTLLERGPDGSSFLVPMPVRLPKGYVLLGTSLADEPSQRNFLVREIPVLLDVETGQQTELPNLPHTIDPTVFEPPATPEP